MIFFVHIVNTTGDFSFYTIIFPLCQYGANYSTEQISVGELTVFPDDCILGAFIDYVLYSKENNTHSVLNHYIKASIKLTAGFLKWHLNPDLSPWMHHFWESDWDRCLATTVVV